jgi:hypothetical protein
MPELVAQHDQVVSRPFLTEMAGDMAKIQTRSQWRTVVLARLAAPLPGGRGLHFRLESICYLHNAACLSRFQSNTAGASEILSHAGGLVRGSGGRFVRQRGLLNAG